MKDKFLSGIVLSGKCLLNVIYVPIKLVAIVFNFFAETIDTVRQ
ncbi:MAG: hypothetical protein SPL13_00585 [Clostridia bacterium]|nr:hypothetical protein [Clostridia bacterium]